jgi:transposase
MMVRHRAPPEITVEGGESGCRSHGDYQKGESRAGQAGQEEKADAPSPAVVSGAAPLRVVPPPVVPDPEVRERASRRRFTAEYKLQILRQADQCAEVGELGALLRREGLYSSHLTTWRRQREQGALVALAPKKRGRPTAPVSPLARRVAELERDNARLERRLKQAEAIIDAQKSCPRSWASRCRHPARPRAAVERRDRPRRAGRVAAGV